MVDLKLPATIANFTQQILSTQQELLFELTAALGSPLHIILPQLVEQKIREFQQVLNKSEVKYELLYAHKANKSAAILEVCAKNNLSIDVASHGEFCQALQHGFPGTAISISGPIKNKRLLLLALQHQALIQIDSLQELELVISIREKLKSRSRARILFRYAATANSRFGLVENEIVTSLNHLSQFTHLIELEGFSFHLAGYDLEARGQMIITLIKLIQLARQQGFAANIIDIGGGIPIAYLDQDSWNNFLNNNSSQLFHAQRKFSNFYPYYSALTGPAFLKSLLDWQPSPESKSIATILKEHAIKLLLEPGRSLLDQGGITIFKVNGVKELVDYAIVTVAGTSFSLSEQWFDSEFLPDPVHLPVAAKLSPNIFRACVGGASCLESDVISWRKIVFSSPIETDDLLVYINTAGYQMDSNESEFHYLPLPQKIALYQIQDKIHWKTDAEFSQLDLGENEC